MGLVPADIPTRKRRFKLFSVPSLFFSFAVCKLASMCARVPRNIRSAKALDTAESNYLRDAGCHTFSKYPESTNLGAGRARSKTK